MVETFLIRMVTCDFFKAHYPLGPFRVAGNCWTEIMQAMQHSFKMFTIVSFHPCHHFETIHSKEMLEDWFRLSPCVFHDVTTYTFDGCELTEQGFQTVCSFGACWVRIFFYPFSAKRFMLLMQKKYSQKSLRRQAKSAQSVHFMWWSKTFDSVFIWPAGHQWPRLQLFEETWIWPRIEALWSCFPRKPGSGHRLRHCDLVSQGNLDLAMDWGTVIWFPKETRIWSQTEALWSGFPRKPGSGHGLRHCDLVSQGNLDLAMDWGTVILFPKETWIWPQTSF